MSATITDINNINFTDITNKTTEQLVQHIPLSKNQRKSVS